MNIRTAVIENDMFRHASCLPQNNEIKYRTSIYISYMEKCNVRMYYKKSKIVKLGKK